MICNRPTGRAGALSSVGRASGLQPEGRGFKSPSVHFACHRFESWTLCHGLPSLRSVQPVGPSALNRLAGLFVLDINAHQLLEKFGLESMSMHRFHPSITANLQDEFTALMFTEPNIVNFDG